MCLSGLLKAPGWHFVYHAGLDHDLPYHSPAFLSLTTNRLEYIHHSYRSHPESSMANWREEYLAALGIRDEREKANTALYDACRKTYIMYSTITQDNGNTHQALQIPAWQTVLPAPPRPQPTKSNNKNNHHRRHPQATHQSLQRYHPGNPLSTPHQLQTLSRPRGPTCPPHSARGLSCRNNYRARVQN